MKRKIVMTMIGLLALTGCVKTPSEDSTEGLSLAAVQEKPSYSQKLKKTVQRDGSYRVEEYNADDLVLKSTFYDADGAVRTTFSYTYDGNQNQISAVTEKADGTIRLEKKEYDADGNLLRVLEGSSEDSLTLKRELKYEGGLLMQETYYEDDGSVDHTYDYEYEYENGLLVRKTKILPDGYVYRSWDYEYDSAGRLAKMTDTYHEHRDIEYYDDREQVVREEHFFRDELSGVYVNTYGEYGIEETVVTEPDGSERSHGWTYYENGLRTRTVNVNADGEETETGRWEYDADGRLVHFTSPRGYENFLGYNEYGDIAWEHNMCFDPLRDAGTYDERVYYEYIYQ